MKKILILLSVASLIVMAACQKEKQGETIKVGVSFEKDAKNQKINVERDGTEAAYIDWTENDQIRLVNSSDNTSIVVTFEEKLDSETAIFTLSEDDNLSSDISYMAYYPSSVTPSGAFTTPDRYEINPNSVDAYLNTNLLMYTKGDNLYKHGTSPKVELTPAMTILEMPLKANSGTIIIDDIILYARSSTGNKVNAFIKSATLPNLSYPTYVDSIHYQFTTSLIVNTTETSVKLLIWSNNTASNLHHYTVCINGVETDGLHYFKRNRNKDSAFLNSTYYTIAALSIPFPQAGDFYQGGYVCSAYVDEGITKGYIAATADLNGTYSFANKKDDLDNITTTTGLGTGEENTINILNKYSNAPAAFECRKYTGSYPYKNFNDWFLPSVDELNLMLTSGNLTSTTYWSSEKDGKNHARNFTNGTSSKSKVDNSFHYVRPMRYF